MPSRSSTVALLLCASALAASLPVHAGAPVYIPPPREKPPEPKAAPEPSRYKLLVLDLKGNDVDAKTTATIQGLVVANLAFYPELDVISGDDMKNLVSLEAERQTAGCSDDAGCLAEIADALGAQLVAFGNVGRLGDSIVVNLSLFDSVKAVGLGRAVVQAEDLKRLPKKLRPKIHELVGRFYAEKQLPLPALPVEKEEPPAPVAERFDPGPWPWVLSGTGAGLLVLGGAAAAAGFFPYLSYQGQRSEVLALEKDFKKSGDASVAVDARAVQDQMQANVDSWNTWGVFAADIGAPLAAVGLVLGAGGLLWGVVSGGDEEAGAALPPPPAANTTTMTSTTTTQIAPGGAGAGAAR